MRAAEWHRAQRAALFRQKSARPLVLSLTSLVVLGKRHRLSEPRVPPLKKGIKTSLPLCGITIRRIKTVKQPTLSDG